MTFYSLERATKAMFPNIGIPQEFFCEIKIFETLIGRELTLLQYNISSETVFLRSKSERYQEELWPLLFLVKDVTRIYTTEYSTFSSFANEEFQREHLTNTVVLYECN